MFVPCYERCTSSVLGSATLAQDMCDTILKATLGTFKGCFSSQGLSYNIAHQPDCKGNIPLFVQTEATFLASSPLFLLTVVGYGYTLGGCMEYTRCLAEQFWHIIKLSAAVMFTQTLRFGLLTCFFSFDPGIAGTPLLCVHSHLHIFCCCSVSLHFFSYGI